MTSEIEAFAKAWDSKFNAGDMPGLSAFYAKTARVIPAGGAPVEGADDAGAFFADVRSKGLTTHSIEVVSIDDRGDTAIASGKWRLSGSGEGSDSQTFGGNWVNVLARDGGSWKILLHTWN